MKRVLFLLLTAAACSGSGGPSGGVDPTGPPTSQEDPGAANPTLAIQTFMAAIKAQNLDALAVIWGSDRGAARDIVDATQLRKRELIMECYFMFDSYVIVSDVTSSEGVHVATLQVTKGSLTRETKTQVVRGPKGRWYVASPELAPLKDLCAQPNTQ
jgi:hypothetical protein